ncbi:uncharacterized protein [Canis lupus baileyi]|uniref:uncharacterized protein isoform X1 n=1 Tax=Canis lupus baileyi TaxID=143281 RepID=UPI003B971D1C
MRGLRPSPRSLSGQTDQPEETELGTRAQGTGRWRCSSMLLWKGFDLVPRILCEGEDPRQPNAEGIRPAQRRPRRPRRPPPLPEVPAGLGSTCTRRTATAGDGVRVCKQLEASGAAILASTGSDIETAADECEDTEEGDPRGSQLRYAAREELGVMSKGAVHALWATRPGTAVSCPSPGCHRHPPGGASRERDEAGSRGDRPGGLRAQNQTPAAHAPCPSTALGALPGPARPGLACPPPSRRAAEPPSPRPPCCSPGKLKPGVAAMELL